ncbi:hypothetical protein [Neisseria mucosa]|uniref:hypothetical protein n=1 Tax=Neisseria mucosa TaxID=488 RepID=UPI00280ADA37|nr:hypothetical protein [Neisseria mucosa]
MRYCPILILIDYTSNRLRAAFFQSGYGGQLFAFQEFEERRLPAGFYITSNLGSPGWRGHHGSGSDGSSQSKKLLFTGWVLLPKGQAQSLFPKILPNIEDWENAGEASRHPNIKTEQIFFITIP